MGVAYYATVENKRRMQYLLHNKQCKTVPMVLLTTYLSYASLVLKYYDARFSTQRNSTKVPKNQYQSTIDFAGHSTKVPGRGQEGSTQPLWNQRVR